MAVTRLAKVDVDGDVLDYSGRKLAAKDRATHTGTQLASTISDLTEAVQDIVASTLVQGSGMTITYNDAAGTITLVAAGGGGGLDAEATLDFLAGVTTVGQGLLGGTNITLSYNDAGNALTINTSATVNATDAQLRDRTTHTGTQLANTISNFNTAVSSAANPYVDSSIATYSAGHPYAWRIWDTTTTSWSARPALPTGVPALADSSLDTAATPPPGSLRYDKWWPAADSPYWPA
jgi:hypothetical protein